MKITISIIALSVAFILCVGFAAILSLDEEKTEQPTGSLNVRVTGNNLAYSTSSVTNGAVTTVTAIPSGLGGLHVQQTSAFVVWCKLENQTAASSTLVAGSGRLIGPVASTTQWGPNFLDIGPEALLNYVGGNLNCISSNGTSTLAIEKF